MVPRGIQGIMNSHGRNFAALFLFCFISFGFAFSQTPQFIPFSTVQPVLNAYAGSLPAELKPNGQLTATAWDNWVRDQDKDIRVRIEQGEENTLTNLLRLGVTYTTQPRITYEYLAQYGSSSFVNSIADKRANDLVKALSAPHPSAGMLEMRALLKKKGYSLKTPADQAKVKAYLVGTWPACAMMWRGTRRKPRSTSFRPSRIAASLPTAIFIPITPSISIFST